MTCQQSELLLLKYGSSFSKAHTLAGHSFRKGFSFDGYFCANIDLQVFQSLFLSSLKHLCLTLSFHYNQLPLACYSLQGLCLNHICIRTIALLAVDQVIFGVPYVNENTSKC